MSSRAFRPTTAILISLLFTAIACACRYTVRDIGFVELRGPEYSLVATLQLPRAAEVARENPSVQPPVDQWLGTLRQQLADSNIQLSFMYPTSDLSAKPSDGEPVQTIKSLRLIDRTGRALDLSDQLPQHLTAPEKDKLGHSPADQADALKEWLRAVIFSQTLDALSADAIDSFVQIVVIDGSKPESNLAACEVADQAVSAIRKIEPMLPRPIAFPVRVRTVEYGQRPSEKMLLWSAGIESTASQTTASDTTATGAEAATDVTNDPSSARENGDKEPLLLVLYGRARLAGPVMRGSAITLRETLAQLALVGESCECETDRAWMDERVLPFRWSSDSRQTAANTLGFDPDSPLVQAEMTRIVSQGFNSARTKREQGEGSDAIERLLLGYAEAELKPYTETTRHSSSDPGQVPAENTASGLPATTALSSVRAQIVEGDGWGFDESLPPEATSAAPPPHTLTTTETTTGSTQPDTLAKTEPSSSGQLLVSIGVTLGTLFLLAIVLGMIGLGRKS